MAGDKKKSTKNLLEWFISTTGRMANVKVVMEKYVMLLYPEAAATVVHKRYEGSNNGRGLFTVAAKANSTWKEVTVPAAEEINRDPSIAVGNLLDACGGSSFFKSINTELRSQFLAEREEAAGADYADSRLRVWMDIVSSPELGGDEENLAYALVHIFAEIVLGLNEGQLRSGGNGLIGMMLQSSRMTVEAPEESAEPATAAPVNEHPKNIRMLGRRKLEKEKENLIADRLAGAVKVRMLNITAIGLIDGHENEDKLDYKRNIFEDCLENGTKFEVILPKPGSIGESDAGTFKLTQGYKGKDGMTMIARTREKLISDLRYMKDRQDKRNPDDLVPPITLSFTECAIPYALMIVTFCEDEEDIDERDHVKVDLLSPYLQDDLTRRSFYVSRVEDPDNYNFFVDNYRAVQQNAISLGLFEKQQEKLKKERENQN